MQVLAKTRQSDIATVYIGRFDDGREIEFVESIQPPYPIEKKWVFIISTLYGCPVGCSFCDAGYFYKGKLSKEEIIAQVDYLIKTRFPDGIVPIEKFKIQFARMGDPAFNPAVIETLWDLPNLYDIKGFHPSISTVAPRSTDKFFEDIIAVKKEKYIGKFQMQFSIHTTDEVQREELIPVKKWSFKEIGNWADKFLAPGDQKITLNFALAQNNELSVEKLLDNFDPKQFLIKITPVNPTNRAMENGIKTSLRDQNDTLEVISSLEESGYDVIKSIGELEENQVGSNCGQHLMNFHKNSKGELKAYTYELEEISQ